MWLRNLPNNYEIKESNVWNLNFLWHQNNIYIMDNHLAAAYCWFQECERNEDYNFCHIDFHNDFLCDASLEEYKQVLNVKTIDEYCNLRNNSSLQLFRWDNYIKPMQILFPNWFRHNIFFSERGNVDGLTRDLIQEMHIKYIAPINLHNNLAKIFQEAPSRPYSNLKWIVNLDLDIFFNDDGERIFDNEFVRSIARTINDNMNKIKVLTICLSPECCGKDRKEGWKQSIDVLNIFCSEISLLSGKQFPKDYN